MARFRCAVSKCGIYSGIKIDKVFKFCCVPKVICKHGDVILEPSQRRADLLGFTRIKKNGLTETQIGKLRVCFELVFSGESLVFILSQRVALKKLWTPQVMLTSAAQFSLFILLSLYFKSTCFFLKIMDSIGYVDPCCSVQFIYPPHTVTKEPWEMVQKLLKHTQAGYKI